MHTCCGTNGKGSTAHMLASILQEAGYKVGLYTSPFKDFRERIKLMVKIFPKNLYVILLILTSHFEANDISFLR
jgi:dihydrofolate synthase/folylpolyglutamate synthase